MHRDADGDNLLNRKDDVRAVPEKKTGLCSRTAAFFIYILDTAASAPDGTAFLKSTIDKSPENTPILCAEHQAAFAHVLTGITAQVRMANMVKIQILTIIQAVAAVFRHIQIQTGIDDRLEYTVGEIFLKRLRLADRISLIFQSVE